MSGWKTYTCEILNKPAIVMVDSSFPVSDLPAIAWFAVYCNLPPAGLCWDDRETEALDRVEDKLLDISGQVSNGWAVYVLRIATPGIREYYLYHSPQVEMRRAFDSIKEAEPDYKIEFAITHDPDWDQYRKYVGYRKKSFFNRIANLLMGRNQ